MGLSHWGLLSLLKEQPVPVCSFSSSVISVFMCASPHIKEHSLLFLSLLL